MTRLLLWLNRLWHAYRDAKQPHVKVRDEWRLKRQGDTDR